MRASIRRDDQGMTLVEVLVALGVFGVLMGMVTAIMIGGLRSIASASTANEVQAQEQNSMEWMSRLLRFIDNPVKNTSTNAAILSATPASMSFFTYAGTGTVDREAYRVMLCTTSRGIESFVWEPALSAGVPVNNTSPNMIAPTCDDTGANGSQRRVLVPKTTKHTPSMAFRYWRERTAADGVGSGDIELVPSGSLTTTQLAQLAKVQITLNDTLVTVPLTQTVMLVNSR